MFWSLPSVTSRPSAFGLNSGSCFRCPYLLIQAQVFCFLLSAFLLRAEKPPCSLMDCHGAMCLTCCSPPSLDIVNMSRSPWLWKATPSDLTSSLSMCGFRPKAALTVTFHAWETAGLAWAQEVVETCQGYYSSSILLRCVLNSLPASGARAAIWGTQPFEEGAMLNSACIFLDKSLHHPESLFWERADVLHSPRSAFIRSLTPAL